MLYNCEIPLDLSCFKRAHNKLSHQDFNIFSRSSTSCRPVADKSVTGSDKIQHSNFSAQDLL